MRKFTTEEQNEVNALEKRLNQFYYGNENGKESFQHFHTHRQLPSPEITNSEVKYIIEQLQQLWKNRLI